MEKLKNFKNLDTYTLVTTGEEFPNARSVHTIDLDGTFLMLTSKDSLKAQEIAQNNKVCLFHTFMDESASFVEQRLFAELKIRTDISVESYKEEYIKKYPYMANSIEYILLPFESKVIYEIVPVKLQITTPRNTENIVF